ncbi:MAG: hypothetical protein ACLPRE_12230, partial [Limisphaerales bacterium]
MNRADSGMIRPPTLNSTRATKSVGSITSTNGLVLIHEVNATNTPVSYLGVSTYTNSSFSYVVPP